MSIKGNKKVGRPRSIDLEGLLGAAAKMDLSTISMKSLAEHLGIGVATVYRYVKDRDSLVRLAVARAGHRSPPEDSGQDWRELVKAYADSAFSSLSRNPALLHSYIDGQLGGELEVEFVDHFLGAMTRRGFSARRSLEIFQALGLVALGTAVATAHMQAHGAFASSVRAALHDREDGELHNICMAETAYVELVGRPDLASAISILLSGITGPEPQ